MPQRNPPTVSNGTPFRLAVLVADAIPEERVRLFGDMDRWFSEMLADTVPRIRFSAFQAHSGDLPRCSKAHDGYLITGSSADAFSEADWVRRLGDFAISAQRNRPVVGICFGHQLIHHRMGGKVGRAPSGWGVGVHRYAVGKGADWMRPAAKDLALVVSHQDQVLVAAPGSRIHAMSNDCPVAVSTIGSTVLTFQGHPEMTKDNARYLYEMRRAHLGHDLANKAVASLDQAVSDDVAAAWIVNFLIAARAL